MGNSVKSTLGNMVYTVKDNLSTVLNTAKSQIENIVGTATTGLTNIWAGGFTGMSDAGINELKTALEKYCDEIQGLINAFDQKGDITMALKGDAQVAAVEFIESVKTLLQAYVSTMKQEIAEVDEAYKNFIAAGKSISQDVSNTANDIRSNASQISLD